MRTVVLGLQYGDEAKGKVVGSFAKEYDWNVRFTGSCNAGHTVYNEAGKKFKLHHIPCGAVFGKKVALDSGMVINLKILNEELDMLKENGIEPDLYISDNVHLATHTHLKKDASGSSVGSTKRGVAYTYSDRALRAGVRVEDIIGSVKFDRVADVSDLVLSPAHINFKSYRGLPPIKKGESAIYEGAQGIMLDIDYGCYPYVTSGNLIPSMAHKIDKTIGVMKAYTSRVGDGPPYDPDIEDLRIRGQEYGTTTGRPRRCHWNDLDQLDYAMSLVQPDEVVVTKLDVLQGLTNIGVYRNHKFLLLGDLDNYKQFLLDTYPQIRWFSESPGMEIIKVR